MRRVAIVGGGIAGLTAAYQLACLARDGVPVEAVLYEASSRLGGLIETVREGGFTVEAGPDGWITAKPWARELATELGLAGELIPSNDATRKTWILLTTPDDPVGRLVPMPDGMNMMVPANLDALLDNQNGHAAPYLFTAAAIEAYRDEPARAAELLGAIPADDESIADFTLRHFGPEVLERVAAPLLSGVFGGDVGRLSVRAVMPAFVRMEREYGSLIAALQSTTNRKPPTPEAIFTTLRTGLGTLIDHLIAAVPEHWLRLNTTVTRLESPTADLSKWRVSTSTTGKRLASDTFDAVFLAAPIDAARQLLTPLDSKAAQLLPTESSSAVLVAFCFPDAAHVPVPPGFGFLVPRKLGETEAAADTTSTLLLACTFTDQKFADRVPPGGRLIRAFFGGAAADRLARCNNDEIAAIARAELARILNSHSHARAPLTGPLPTPLPAPVVTVVRRWPNSLPQYAVGHLDRVAELESRLRSLPGLTLLGNALHGVGIPDLIRDARAAARQAALNY
jgi:oxygen-dependent protoporphyrinogen oxidase